jgi:hypothetical protein
MKQLHAAVRRSRAGGSRSGALAALATWIACAGGALGQPAPPLATPPVAAPPVAAPDASPAPQTAPGDAGPSAASATFLSLAEDAMTKVDYDRARELARESITRGSLDRDGLIRAYRLIAIASAQLGEDAAAEQAFVRLFALEPNSNVQSRLAPARRSAVLNAHGFWAVRGGFGLDVSYARRERKLLVRVRDPLVWVDTVHLFWRVSDGQYTKLQRPAATELSFDSIEVGPTDAVEVYAYGVDAHGNVLVSYAQARDPHIFELSDEELAEFMRRDIRGGQTGSYARRLEELGVNVAVHGYLSLEFKPVDDVPSFDLHHATAMIRASIQNAVSLELALEWEHLARSDGDFYLPHAFVDLKLSEALILRAGFFEVPVGAFNEYLYPDFLRITGLPPSFSRSVVPALWSEVGVQLRGRAALDGNTNLTYAAFISNGLEQPDPTPDDGEVAEGGDLRAMRFHDRDRFSGNKGVGGRVGLELGEFDLGVSGYTGRYAVEAPRQLSIADVDISYRTAWLTLRTEAALAWQEVSGELLRKYGSYTLLALRPIPHLEPYAQYDYVNVKRWNQRVLLGLAFYPFPNDRSTRHLRLKSEAGIDFFKNQERVFVWFFQLTSAF